ncbi:hypothetical protein [Mesorhizobium sp.]|nr:hypothetical protein [Mesorhizobium sp.]
MTFGASLAGDDQVLVRLSGTQQNTNDADGLAKLAEVGFCKAVRFGYTV